MRYDNALLIVNTSLALLQVIPVDNLRASTGYMITYFRGCIPQLNE